MRRDEDGAPSGSNARAGGQPHRSPPPGVRTLVEALAQAQALLDFPLEASKMDAWRAKIQRLIDYAGQDAHADTSARSRPSAPSQGEDRRSERHATSAQSPRHHPRTRHRDDRRDGMSMMSSSSRYYRDQRHTLRDRQAEDVRTHIA